MNNCCNKRILPFPSAQHAVFIQTVLGKANVAVTADATDREIHAGLAAVNNDACYSAILSGGQTLRFGVGKDTNQYGVIAPDLCVKCRCEDMRYLIANALQADSMYRSDEVVSFWDFINELPEEQQRRLAAAVIVGDIVLQARWALKIRVTGRCKDLDDTIEALSDMVCKMLEDEHVSVVDMCEYAWSQLAEFADVADGQELPRVGIVGSPTALYCPQINADLLDTLVGEGCQPVLPYFIAFLQYSAKQKNAAPFFIEAAEVEIKAVNEWIQKQDRAGTWEPCLTYNEYQELASELVPSFITQGMGWLLAGQILTLWNRGITSVIYAATFGCLSGHVVGQGIMKRVREICPGINLAVVEYDPGTSPINQVNRVKLLTAVAIQQTALR